MQPHKAEHGVGHRQIDIRALSAAGAFDQAHGYRLADCHARHEVCQGYLRLYRLAAVVKELIHNAGHCKVIQVVTGKGAVGARLPIAGNGDIHKSGI